jgi:hypothetical protein
VPVKQDDDTSYDSSIRPDFLNDLGISPEEQASMEARAISGADQDKAARREMSPEQLAANESAGDNGKGSKAETDEKGRLGESLFNDKDGKSDSGGSGWKTKLANGKNGAKGGVVGLLLGGSIGLFGIFQGPLQIIHFSQLLDRFHFQTNSDFSNSRTMKMMRYLRYANSDHPERRRLGIVMNRYANAIETRWARAGYQPVYDGPRNTLNGMRISPDVDTRPFERAGVELSEPDADGFRRANFDDMTYGQRRSALREVSKASGHNRVVSAINTRVLAARGGVSFKLFNNIRRSANESLSDYHKRVRQRLASYFKEGSSSPGFRTQPRQVTNEDGTTSNEPRAETESREGNRIADEVSGDTDPDNKVGRNTHRVRNNINRGAGAIGLLCLARAVSNGYAATQYFNIILPLMRNGAGIMSMGAQVMAGQGLNMEELGAVITKLHTDDLGPWVSARSIQAELGHEHTGPDIPATARPARANELPLALQIVDSIFSGLGMVGTAACSTAGGIILSVVGGPASIVTDLAIEAALRISGVDPVEIIVRLIAGEEVDSFASGSTLGNFANYGSRLSANDQIIGMGGQELNEAQEFELDQEVRTAYLEELQNMPLSDRLFAIDSPDSLVGQVMIRQYVPGSAQDALSRVASLPVDLIASVSSSFASFGTKPAYAQSVNNGYDYGFPMYGYTAAERDDPRNDPHEVAREFDDIIKSRTQAEEDCARRVGVAPGEEPCNWIPSNVGEFNEVYESCFGAEIIEHYGPDNVEAFRQTKTVNYFSSKTKDPQHGKPEYCERSTAENGIPGYYDSRQIGHSSRQQAENDWRVFRFYLADTVNGHSVLCYEGEKSSCDLFGYGGAAPGGNESSGGLGINDDGFVFPLQTDKQTIINNSPRWCYQSQSNCHHNYNAADIFAPTGTPVVAARGGTVVRAVDNDNAAVGSRVTIKGDDGNLYYYAHLGDGTVRVSAGQTVTAGTVLGAVGTDADAVGTPKHLHFDILPPQYDSRPSCSGASCRSYPFINPQPALVSSFEGLP